MTPANPGWPRDSLITAAQRGDSESIRALLSVSHPHVHRFARSICLTEQDAEDAAQEALIILYRKIGTLRASAALASWLLRIVRNECLRRLAATRRWRAETTPAADAAHSASAESEVIKRLETDRVSTAILALPSDQRQVLVLRDLYGYSGTQVADHLGLSVAAMKSRLHRARTALRTELDERYQ